MVPREFLVPSVEEASVAEKLVLDALVKTRLELDVFLVPILG